MKSLQDFKEKWVVDYEFYGNSGDTPIPVCYCAKEIHSGKCYKEWILDDITGNPLYNIGEEALFIAFYAPAEMSCHMVLDYPRPANIIDLYAEFRNETNGLFLRHGNGLLGACHYYGIPNGDATLKDAMRDRILQGPPFSDGEKVQILNYCMRDVELTADLFEKMKGSIHVPRAIYRGRYMYSVAKMENYGVPIDMEAFSLLRNNWDVIKSNLIEKVDTSYDVYEGKVFKLEKFEYFLTKNNIPWDTTTSGRPRTDDEYMKDQAKTFPILKPLQELRYTMGQLKLNDLQVGSDGRNRAMLSPFRSLTGRNQPSSSKFIFGNAIWLRNLIKPSYGHSLAYIDYEQEEIGIAAALSGDKYLTDAYNSGDPYIAFAKRAGAVPPDANKNTHSDIREKFKTCMLALNYGMHHTTFAKRANLSIPVANDMFKMHKNLYQTYWKWIANFMDSGQLTGRVSTRAGWHYFTYGSKSRSIQNFPMQANGAEILRIACMLCIENGLKIVAPVHDALLLESKTSDIEEDVSFASDLMIEASKHVIKFPLRVDAKIIDYPNHYTDKRGDMMWGTIMGIVNDQSREA